MEYLTTAATGIGFWFKNYSGNVVQPNDDFSGSESVFGLKIVARTCEWFESYHGDNATFGVFLRRPGNAGPTLLVINKQIIRNQLYRRKYVKPRMASECFTYHI